MITVRSLTVQVLELLPESMIRTPVTQLFSRIAQVVETSHISLVVGAERILPKTECSMWVSRMSSLSVALHCCRDCLSVDIDKVLHELTRLLAMRSPYSSAQ